MEPRRVLIAYDGSPSSRAAARRSAALLPGAEALVVTAASGPGRLTNAASATRLALPDEVVRTAASRLAESALDAARGLAETGARVASEAGLQARGEAVAAEGSICSALLAKARSERADVIACGTHGYGRVARAILGSVSSDLVRHGGMPVLVVPEEAGEANGGAGPVLAAFDGSDLSAQALTAAAALLEEREIVVLHVWRSEVRHSLSAQALAHLPVPTVRALMDDLEREFEQVSREVGDRGAALVRDAGTDARPLLVESAGPVAATIVEQARDLDAAAIVMGRRGLGAMSSALLGSVSSSVLHAADRPVLVV